jgi:hypothetical protein
LNEKRRMKHFEEVDCDVVVTSDHKPATGSGVGNAKSDRAQHSAPLSPKTKKQLVGLGIGSALFLLLFIVAFVLLAGRLNYRSYYFSPLTLPCLYTFHLFLSRDVSSDSF